MKIAIKNRLDNSVLFSHEDEENTLKITLSMALKARADLGGADLRGKKLSGKRPFFQLGPIGSRSDYLLAFTSNSGIQLKAGCFSGSIDEFELALDAEHDENEHATEYSAALVLIRQHVALWPATLESEEVAT